MLSAILAGAVVMLLALGTATVLGSSAAHRALTSHATAEATGVDPVPGGDHGGERHPGSGIHVTHACTAILAAGLVILGLIGRRGTSPLRHHVQVLVGAAHHHLLATAGVDPPRVSLCVELR